MLQHQAGDIDTVSKWIRCFKAAGDEALDGHANSTMWTVSNSSSTCPIHNISQGYTQNNPNTHYPNSNKRKYGSYANALEGTGQEYYPQNTQQSYNTLHNNPPQNPIPPRSKPTIEEVARMQPRDLCTGCGWPLSPEKNRHHHGCRHYNKHPQYNYDSNVAYRLSSVANKNNPPLIALNEELEKYFSSQPTGTEPTTGL